jgi:4-hydroxy-tetrahydrodipicolinate reductase
MAHEKPTKVAIAGAAGRMGQRLCALAGAMDGLVLTEAIERAGHPLIGKPAAAETDVVIAERFEGNADVLVDFSTPEGTAENLAACVESGKAICIGTTGLEADHEQQIEQAAGRIALLRAANFSLVVNVLARLAGEAARLLGPEYDIEILEAHHRFKKDAPSGTALTLARRICEQTDRDFDTDVVYARQGREAERKPNEITIQAVRLGDVVGEHTVYFGTIGERMELRHVGGSRDSYATGALHAARWLAGQKPGRYTMNDVLGLE